MEYPVYIFWRLPSILTETKTREIKHKNSLRNLRELSKHSVFINIHISLHTILSRSGLAGIEFVVGNDPPLLPFGAGFLPP